MIEIAKQKAYTVWLNGRHINTVYFTGCDVAYVRTSLIDHDGFSPDIIVVERA